MQKATVTQDPDIPYDAARRAVRAVALSSKARAREALASEGIELLDCCKRGGMVCLVVRQKGEPKRLYFNIKDYSRFDEPDERQRKGLTVTQKARYVELRKNEPSYPWQPTGMEMRGGSKVHSAMGYMEKGHRWWEDYFGMERDSWTCTKHATIQKALDYLVRKAGGQVHASHQSRKHILVSLGLFCRQYRLSPEDMCKKSPGELSRLVQEFCDAWMKAGKSATAQNRLVSLGIFFDKNCYPRGTDRGLTLQGYGYHVGQSKLPTWNHGTEEYKPSRAEAWRMAHSCGSTLEGLRDKATILFLLGTGARSGDIRALHYGRTYHFKGMEFNIKEQLSRWDGKSIVIPITLELKKVVNEACKYRRQHLKLLFLEGVESLKDYLAERERLYGTIADDEPLFASHGKNLPEQVWRSQPMSPGNLCRIVKLAARRAFQGSAEHSERWRGVHPHVFKDCFLEILDHGDALTGTQILSQNDKDFLMGHRLAGSMDSYYNPKKIDELKEKWLRLAWTEKLPGTTPIELRKRQTTDWMAFIGVPEDVQDKVRAVMAEWNSPEDFENGLPTIRAIIKGRGAKSAELEASMPGYRTELREGRAYVGTPQWLGQQIAKTKQRVVNNEDAEKLLEEGWIIKLALSNGKCVVERQA